MDDVLLAKSGDRAAFGRLVVAQQNHICGLAQSIVRDGALAEDVAQEAFVRAWRALGELRDENAFVGWLRQTTRRLAVNAWHERKRRARLVPETPLIANDDLERREILAFVDAALLSLRDDEREILIAHLREELSLRELALRLGVSEAAAQKPLSRARLKLQKETESRLATGLKRVAPGAAFALAIFASIDAQASVPAAKARVSALAKIAGVAASLVVAGAAFFIFSALCSPLPKASSVESQPTPTKVVKVVVPKATSVAALPEQKALPSECPSSKDSMSGWAEGAFGYRGTSVAIKEVKEKWASSGDMLSGFRILGRDGYYKELDAPAEAVLVALIERCGATPALDIYWPAAPMTPAIAAAWKSTLAAHPNNAYALVNAAHFYFDSDRSHARQLIERAVALEPANPKWASRLAGTYSDPKDHDDAENLLGFLQRAEGQTTDRMAMRWQLAQAALAADEEKEAQRYAEEILQTPSAGDFDLEQPIAHSVLGEIALNHGDVETAKAQLLASAKTISQPMLSFSLAKKLLALGEDDVVLALFDELNGTWMSDCVSRWRSNILQKQPIDASGDCEMWNSN